MPATTPRCPDNRQELRVHDTVYIYACIVITYSRVQINRKIANPVHGQLNRKKNPCPHSRMKIWFRETGLAVPSRVSLLIVYTNAESGAYSRDSSRNPRRRPYIFTTIHHRVSHDFIGSRNCVQMAFTAESLLCSNIVTDAVHTVDPFPPLDLCLYKCKELVYTVQYHMLCFKTYRQLLLLYCRPVFPLPTYACTSVRS